MEGVALLDEQQAEEFVQLIVLFHLEDGFFLLGGEVQVRVKGGRDQIRLNLAALGGQYPHPPGQIVVDLHEPHSDQAVEPGVGHFLHDVPVGGGVVGVRCPMADGLGYVPPLPERRLTADGIGGSGADVVELRRCVRLWQGRLDALFRNPHQPCPIAHIGGELVPGPDGKIFNSSFIHG